MDDKQYKKMWKALKRDMKQYIKIVDGEGKFCAKERNYEEALECQIIVHYFTKFLEINIENIERGYFDE